MAKISNCPKCDQKVTIPGAVEPSALVRCPLCGGEFPLADTAASAEDAPPELVPVSPAQQVPTVRLWEQVLEAPQIDVGGSGSAGAERGEFRSVKTDDSRSADAAGGGIGRRKKHKSLVREIVEYVLGGVAGLLLAYYALNLFGGPRFDFAKIYLPGVQHTVKHRPAWWPRWLGAHHTPLRPMWGP